MSGEKKPLSHTSLSLFEQHATSGYNRYFPEDARFLAEALEGQRAAKNGQELYERAHKYLGEKPNGDLLQKHLTVYKNLALVDAAATCFVLEALPETDAIKNIYGLTPADIINPDNNTFIPTERVTRRLLPYSNKPNLAVDYPSKNIITHYFKLSEAFEASLLSTVNLELEELRKFIHNVAVKASAAHAARFDPSFVGSMRSLFGSIMGRNQRQWPLQLTDREQGVLSTSLSGTTINGAQELREKISGFLIHTINQRPASVGLEYVGDTVVGLIGLKKVLGGMPTQQDDDQLSPDNAIDLVALEDILIPAVHNACRELGMHPNLGFYTRQLIKKDFKLTDTVLNGHGAFK